MSKFFKVGKNTRFYTIYDLRVGSRDMKYNRRSNSYKNNEDWKKISV